MTPSEKAREIVEGYHVGDSADKYPRLTQLIAAALQEVRRDTLEDAAKKMEEYAQISELFTHAATDIRALKGEP